MLDVFQRAEFCRNLRTRYRRFPHFGGQKPQENKKRGPLSPGVLFQGGSTRQALPPTPDSLRRSAAQALAAVIHMFNV